MQGKFKFKRFASVFVLMFSLTDQSFSMPVGVMSRGLFPARIEAARMLGRPSGPVRVKPIVRPPDFHYTDPRRFGEDEELHGGTVRTDREVNRKNYRGAQNLSDCDHYPSQEQVNDCKAKWLLRRLGN